MTSVIIWTTLSAAAALALAVGCIIAYHLYRFAMNRYATVLALFAYTAVSVVLLGLLATAATSI